MADIGPYEYPSSNPPIVTLYTPSAGSTISFRPHDLVASVSGSGTIVSVYIDNILATSMGASLYSISCNTFSIGANIVTITATDSNTLSATNTFSLNYSHAYPTIALTTPTSGSLIQETPIDVFFSVTAAATISSVVVNLVTATPSYHVEVDLYEGANLITCTATDVDGLSVRDVFTYTYLPYFPPVPPEPVVPVPSSTSLTSQYYGLEKHTVGSDGIGKTTEMIRTRFNTDMDSIDDAMVVVHGARRTIEVDTSYYINYNDSQITSVGGPTRLYLPTISFTGKTYYIYNDSGSKMDVMGSINGLNTITMLDKTAITIVYINGSYRKY